MRRAYLLAAVVAAISPCAAGCSSSPSTLSTTTSEGMSTSVAAPRVTECTAGQLEVSYFASSAAMGTGLTGIGIANISAPCWLQGAPSVEFFTTVGPHRRTPISVLLGRPPSHVFPSRPQQVTVEHVAPVTSSLALYPKVSTGFVILSRDIPAGTGTCTLVTSVSLRLPGVARTYTLATRSLTTGVPVVFHLCGEPRTVEVRPILERNLFLKTMVASRP